MFSGGYSQGQHLPMYTEDVMALDSLAVDGPIRLSNKAIIGVANPTSPKEAANKEYVDMEIERVESDINTSVNTALSNISDKLIKTQKFIVGGPDRRRRDFRAFLFRFGI